DFWLARSFCRISGISATSSPILSKSAASGERGTTDLRCLHSLKRFQELDQRALIGVRQICPEVMTFILDKIRTFVCFDEIGNKIGEHFLRGFVVQPLNADLVQVCFDSWN